MRSVLVADDEKEMKTLYLGRGIIIYVSFGNCPGLCRSKCSKRSTYYQGIY